MTSIFVLCAALAVSALVRIGIGPILWQTFQRRLARRFSGLLSQERPGRFAGSPYRDANVARIHSLEAENLTLKDRLLELKTKLKNASEEVEQCDALIDRLWHQRRDFERVPPVPVGFGQARLFGLCCVFLVSGFFMGDLSQIPDNTRPEAGSRVDLRSRPTMINLPVLTAGEPFAEPQQLHYVIVLVRSQRHAPSWSHEDYLELRPTYAILDHPREEEWVRIVWLLATLEPEPPQIPLRL